MLKPLLFVFIIAFSACQLSNSNAVNQPNTELAALFNRYWDERMRLFPLEATATGDNRYNHLLPIDFTESYHDTLKEFFSRYKSYLQSYKRDNLNQQDQQSFDIFTREMDLNLQGLTFHDNYTPINQFFSLHLTMAQLGSGDGNQPFKTVRDYEDWLSRMQAFSAWTDSAIMYFEKGIRANYVLPAVLVERIIPQLQAMQVPDVDSSLFMMPIKKFPASFGDTDKDRLAAAYRQTVANDIVPSYKKLANFLQTAYLPKATASHGIGALPDGNAYYSYLIRVHTTTNMSAEEIYQVGLNEVARIRKLQDSIKKTVEFKGDLQAFFEFMKTDRQFMPYTSAGQVINAFDSIHALIKPNLKSMFNQVPKTAFEIRQTEAFRAATASAEYFAGSPDGTRPGIFYVPVIDAKTFNTTTGTESLFLHEAIPGHHYQISLQQEDTTLPKFRRFGGNNAYIEGWALYCESLGKELGLYNDPYQYMAALGDEIHRAIRLVVDVAIHTKAMTREEAIAYMMSNEAASEQYATMEIERYMAIPGQALGYKIGALKIAALRSKYQQQAGNKFKLAAFHDQVLKDGAMPLDVLERKLDTWATAQQ